MASSWWSRDTVAVVTGANRGIGLEIVRELAQQGVTVVLTARDSARGQAAVDGLAENGLKGVVFHRLDASDLDSVQSLASWLKRKFGGIDILINNAGIQPPSLDYESAKLVLDTNYYGIKRVTAALLPLMRPSTGGARIVNLTSRAGLYEIIQSESVKNLLRDEDNYTEELADSLAAKYLEDVKAGRGLGPGGWWVPPPPGVQIYGESKIFANVYSSALAKSLKTSQTEGHEVFVASTCPGVTLTDMTHQLMKEGHKPPPGFLIKSAAEGAETAVWLALLPKEEWQRKSGKLFAEGAEYAFGMPPVVKFE